MTHPSAYTPLLWKRRANAQIPNFSFKMILFLFLNHLYMWEQVCLWVQCLQRPERDTRSPGTGIIGSCGLPDMGAKNWSQVLCKGNRLSLTAESHLQSLNICICLVVYVHTWHMHTYLRARVEVRGPLAGVKRCNSTSLDGGALNPASPDPNLWTLCSAALWWNDLHFAHYVASSARQSHVWKGPPGVSMRTRTIERDGISVFPPG